jgi:hypothetical protein
MRPGVYVQEAPLPRIIEPPAIGITAGAFIGTSLKGPSEPVLVTSWSQFVGLFGTITSDDQRASLAPAVYQFFGNGGGQCYVCRVLPSDATKASVTLGDADGDPILVVGAASAGYWGNGIAVDIVHPLDLAQIVQDPGNRSGPFSMQFAPAFDRPMDTRPPLVRPDGVRVNVFDIVVRNTVRGVSVVVERFSNLTLDATSPRYAERVINSSTVGSQYIEVRDLLHGTAMDQVPAVIEREFLSGGSDGSANPSAGDYTEVARLFELIPGNLIFNVPGITDVSGVEDVVQARADSFLVVDAPNITDLTRLLDTAFTTSSYSAVYYPWVAIPDPDPAAQRGSIRWVPPGGSVAGMIMRMDSSRGSFKAPAGVGASLTGVVATSRKLTNVELDLLNNYQINAIRPIRGSGITVMGARTRDFQTTARYISVRRTLNWIKEQAKNASQFALFEPNTPVLWEQLRVANGAFLSELWQVGGLAGRTFAEGFYVKVDSDNNPPSAIANGEVHIEIGVAPVFPAEFVIIRLGQFEADASFVVSEE